MTLPVHLGLEHPNLVWLVVVAILAFAAGLGVNLSRTREQTPDLESGADDDRGT